jgi:hypothetical protein
MKLTNLALVSAALLALVATTNGCKSAESSSTDGSATLGSSEEQLVSDDSESADADDNMEAGVDAPLSGADPSDPGNPADGASDDEVLEKVQVNAAKHFRNGVIGRCLASTRNGNKIQHVFHACRTPWSLKTFDGTITSTYVRDGNKLTITHDFNGFLADGASVSGERVVTYTRNVDASGAVTIEKTRTGNFTGETKKGKAISHTANFSASYDVAAKCITREGSAQTTLGNRQFERVISDFKRCGIGELGCPVSGSITLSLTNVAKDKAVSVTVAFPGGPKMEITRPNGKVVERTLACTAASDDGSDAQE